ncbi:MAG: lysophospholipid acyltransferase family protein [Akkermansia sp.]|nr:lysophospholipid acyltransferase family protein [Akkermansia sp.]
MKIMNLGEHIPGGKRIPEWLLNIGERILGFHDFNVAHSKVEADQEAGSTDNFFRLACKHIPLNYEAKGLENIPAAGPCVVVSNHPHGMSDGLMIGDIVMKARSDVRIVVNEFLHCVRGMRPYQITVDVYGGEEAKRANMSGMREMLKWLRDGHCLIIFPSGSAASWSEQDGRVIDDPWQENMAAIIRKVKPTVVPMHFSGQNGRLFQAVTRLCKEKRSALLAREIKRDRHTLHQVRVGRPIAPNRIEIAESDAALSDYLRLCSMMLRYPDTTAASVVEVPRNMAPIAAPVAPDLLQEEIDSLPEDEHLLYTHKSTGLRIYTAQGSRIPRLLHEIGVQREITFRAVGEGSGTACDTDEYDLYYEHLIMWDPAHKRIAGAYRMGRTDEIVKSRGVTGIYNAEFFTLGSDFINHVKNGLEMGRAFITAPYQKHPASLDTLWMGIGHFVRKFPQYRYLYGTVSVSSEYTVRSRALMYEYLKCHCTNTELAKHVKAKTPPRNMDLLSEDARLLPRGAADLRLLSALVSDLEPDGRSIPVLLRQYLRLAGEMVSFNVDSEFGDTLDCLVVVDLHTAPERLITRYCGTGLKTTVSQAGDA